MKGSEPRDCYFGAGLRCLGLPLDDFCCCLENVKILLCQCHVSTFVGVNEIHQHVTPTETKQDPLNYFKLGLL